MKLIIAHLPTDAFESVRTALLDLGVLRITVSEVHSSGPLSVTTLHYRGAALHTHMRAELRLECVTSADQSPAVVNVLRGHSSTSWGVNRSVAVLEVEALHHPSPGGHLFPDDPRMEAAVCS